MRFYDNVPDQARPTRKEVLNYSDYTLQVRDRYLKWLFPLDSDKEDTRLTKGMIYKFKDKRRKTQVIEAVLRMMSFLGYTLNVENKHIVGVKQIKPLYRDKGDIVIGLYNTNTYPRITRILQFLEKIDMTFLSSLLFLCLCRAMKDDPELSHRIVSNAVVDDWIKTQPYLKDKRVEAEEALISESLESWEKEHEQEEKLLTLQDAWEEE